MTDDTNQEDEVPRSNATAKLPDNNLSNVLAGASERLNDAERFIPTIGGVPLKSAEEIDAALNELAASMGTHADASRSPASNGFTYDGHSESEIAFVNARIVGLETAIADYNREITATSGNKDVIISMLEAQCADAVERLSVKRENAIRSIESLKAQIKVLGQ